MSSSNALNRGVNVMTTAGDRIKATASGVPVRQAEADWQADVKADVRRVRAVQEVPGGGVRWIGWERVKDAACR